MLLFRTEYLPPDAPNSNVINRGAPPGVVGPGGVVYTTGSHYEYPPAPTYASAPVAEPQGYATVYVPNSDVVVVTGSAVK